VSEPTIWRLETAEGSVGGRPETAEKLIGTLERAGIIFVEADGEGPGVRLRKESRASLQAGEPVRGPAPITKTAPRGKARKRRS
jgi:hypothetical protein